MHQAARPSPDTNTPASRQRTPGPPEQFPPARPRGGSVPVRVSGAGCRGRWRGRLAAVGAGRWRSGDVGTAGELSARASARISSIRTTRPMATATPTGRPAVASAPTNPASQYCRRSSSMKRSDGGQEEQRVGVHRAVQEERVRVEQQDRDGGDRTAPRQPAPHPGGEQHAAPRRRARRAASRRSGSHRRSGRRARAPPSDSSGRTRSRTAGRGCRSSRTWRCRSTSRNRPGTSRPARPGRPDTAADGPAM